MSMFLDNAVAGFKTLAGSLTSPTQEAAHTVSGVDQQLAKHDSEVAQHGLDNPLENLSSTFRNNQVGDMSLDGQVISSQSQRVGAIGRDLARPVLGGISHAAGALDSMIDSEHGHANPILAAVDSAAGALSHETKQRDLSSDIEM